MAARKSLDFNQIATRVVAQATQAGQAGRSVGFAPGGKLKMTQYPIYLPDGWSIATLIIIAAPGGDLRGHLCPPCTELMSTQLGFQPKPLVTPEKPKPSRHP